MTNLSESEQIYTVANGKLMRFTPTARIEVTASEAAKLLNRLTRELKEAREDANDASISWQEATS